uniref:(California timema) hypothetical protein n=1 Tax=Timema californicum TaxID=61474 RepID=A0A7R9J761_TIMCA|nr:unnamed protein product [Timema californicum]
MRVLHKILINLIVVVSFLVCFYAFQTGGFRESRIHNIFENETLLAGRNESIKDNQNGSYGYSTTLRVHETPVSVKHTKHDNYNVWCIFTKVTGNVPMKFKFKTFTRSLMEHSTVYIKFHIITDNSSRTIAEEIIEGLKISFGKFEVVYYSIDILAEKLSDIVTAMQPHFSSQPGTYYSDALFFMSMGLHRIALDQNCVAMFDVDTKLRADVGQLFQEFDSFEESTLFGLAPELTPVYRHVLYVYRSKHKGTKFGEPISKGGFPGVNSGVMLLRLDRMRESVTYNQLLKSAMVEKLASKYQFKGHLGDQDFYTLLGMEHPELIHVLPCTWNRQLCTWWRDHGYQDVFKDFFRCQGPVRLYHGNCNTPIPSD